MFPSELNFNIRNSFCWTLLPYNIIAFLLHNWIMNAFLKKFFFLPQEFGCQLLISAYLQFREKMALLPTLVPVLFSLLPSQSFSFAQLSASSSLLLVAGGHSNNSLSVEVRLALSGISFEIRHDKTWLTEIRISPVVLRTSSTMLTIVLNKKNFNLMLCPIGWMASQPMRNIEIFQGSRPFKGLWLKGLWLKGLVTQRPVAQGLCGSKACGSRAGGSRACGSRALLLKGFVAQRPVAQRPVAQRPVAPGLCGSRACGSRALWLKGFVVQRPVAQGPVALRPVARGLCGSRACGSRA